MSSSAATAFSYLVSTLISLYVTWCLLGLTVTLLYLLLAAGS